VPLVQLRTPLRAVTVKLVPPFHHVAAAPVFLDQLVDMIAALPAAPRTLNAQHVELALDVTKYEIGSGYRVP
jgi:hypothetical protein